MSYKREVKKAKSRSKDLVEWLFYSVVVGLTVGLVGVAFERCLEFAGEFRESHRWMIYLIPLMAVFIIFLYHRAGVPYPKGTNQIIRAAKNEKESVPFRVAPLIFVSTVLSHIVGGSVGREGAALQIGGAMSSYVGRKIHLSHLDSSILVQCGMAAGFASLFGAPLAASVFAMEIIWSEIHYTAMFPVLLSSLVAWTVSSALGSSGTHFTVVGIHDLGVNAIIKVIILGIIISVLSIVFIEFLHRFGKLIQTKLTNQYVRAFSLGIIALGISIAFPGGDYNGAGVGVIEKALAGEAAPYAFIMKMIMTVVCVVAGFKGGLIVPSFFIGATFGCAIGPLLGLNPGFAAGLGMVSFFCSVTNCPIASMVLAFEMFGSEGIMLVALCCAVAYMMSGKYSLYDEQIFKHAKFGFEDREDFDDYKN